MGIKNEKELKTTTDLCIADTDWSQKQFQLSKYHHTTKQDNRHAQPLQFDKSKQERTMRSVRKILRDTAYYVLSKLLHIHCCLYGKAKQLSR